MDPGEGAVMAQETVDTYLDKNGNVVPNAKLAVEMRRVVIEDGVIVKHATYYTERYKPEEGK
jgi:hypothetical protein